MTKEKYRTMVNKAVKILDNKQIDELGSAIVDYDCTKLDKSLFEGQEREDMIMYQTLNIALGSLLTKRKYLLTGCVLGGTVVAFGFVATKLIGKRKKEES